MATYEIKLQNSVNQTFNVNLGTGAYNMRLLWCMALEGFWALDINDDLMNPLVLGAALVAGVDLLGQYESLGMGGHLFCGTDGNWLLPPTKDNLGGTAHLIWEPYS